MANPKKSTRQYDSTRRQEQARQTRRLILEAARALFCERGYAGATVEAIAEEAQVAPETVYAIYASKRGLLAQLIDVTVGGDDQGIQLLDRPGPSQVLQAEDPVRQIELFSADITQILERVAPLFPILRTAAKTEPEIADLLHGLLEFAPGEPGTLRPVAPCQGIAAGGIGSRASDGYRLDVKQPGSFQLAHPGPRPIK